MKYYTWKIKVFFGIVLILFGSSHLFAQTDVTLHEIISINGNGIDWVNEVLPLQDTGWIVAGYSSSSDLESHNAGEWDGLIVRLNANYEQVWIKQIGSPWLDAFTDMVIVNDGIILCGYKSSEKLNKDGWLIKLNFDGDIIWENIYQGKSDDQLFGIDLLPDQSFVISGFTSSDTLTTTYSNTKTDGIVLRVNSDGTLNWIKRFSGKNNDLLVDIAFSSDKKIYASGYSNSSDIGGIKDKDQQDDFWCVALNEDGKQLWSKTYGSVHQEHLTSMDISGDSILLSGGQREINKKSPNQYSLYVSIIDTAGYLIKHFPKNSNSVSFDGIITEGKIIEFGYKSDLNISQIFIGKFENNKILTYTLPPINGRILCATKHKKKNILGAVVTSSDQTEGIKIYEY